MFKVWLYIGIFFFKVCIMFWNADRYVKKTIGIILLILAIEITISVLLFRPRSVVPSVKLSYKTKPNLVPDLSLSSKSKKTKSEVKTETKIEIKQETPKPKYHPIATVKLKPKSECGNRTEVVVQKVSPKKQKPAKTVIEITTTQGKK